MKAVELLRQGRTSELWQMCCGFTELTIEQFMAIQKRLLLEQMGLLSQSSLGRRIMQGAMPETVEEFRRLVPLTTYRDYCPELLDKRDDVLPVKPMAWVRTSGRSGEYPCRWIPMTPQFSREMSQVMYGLGILASCRRAYDTSGVPEHPKVVYTVAPRPYMSGAMASMLELQTPVDYLPPLDEAEKQSFEERIRLGFKQALSDRIDYFFGLSLVLAEVGSKFQSSGRVSVRPLLRQPRALMHLTRGMVRSRLARRSMLPRDVWKVRGIISSGLDSWVYREKIRSMWGRYPLDVYIGTEAGVIATQTWDYDSMTFIPNLNFLEFIPEKEHLKWQSDRSYQPDTLLLDEVKAGEKYELVITNFHGGMMARYRIGDMVRITSLRNERLGIDIPQMLFERRADGLLNFVVLQLTEKQIWQAIERTGIAYADWTAYKVPGQQVLHLLIELREGHYARESDVSSAVKAQILKSGGGEDTAPVLEDLTDMFDFDVRASLLPRGAFARYTAQRQAEGADLAHLKPPHVNPSERVLAVLQSTAEAPAVTGAGSEKVPA